jgi:4-aminobutyrate aminotransferase-like enzyme/Ser/Thr protein kinase RdoA (MazF antagonist)
MLQDAPSSLRIRPSFGESDAEKAALSLWGIEGTATALAGDADRNFRLDSERGRFVLRFVSRGESPAFIALMQRAMKVGAGGRPQVPTPEVLLDGKLQGEWPDADGLVHRVLLSSWVHGEPYAEFRPQGSLLLGSVGESLARLDQRLAPMPAPEAERDSEWDVRRAHLAFPGLINQVTGAARRELLERHMARFQQALPGFSALRRQLIHGDANDHNIMVRFVRGEAPSIGLIDFGDLVRTWLVAEVSVAGAYLAMGHADPVAALAALVAGYHRVTPLTDEEFVAIPHLVAARLCVSVCHSEVRARTEPDDPYQVISQAGGWSLLEKLDDIPPRLASARLRQACGLEPCAGSEHLVNWLTAAHPAPVLGIPLEGPVFDLSVGTTQFDGGLDPTDASVWEAPFWRRMAAENAEMAFGRYLEPRICYRAGQFSAGGAGAERQRTIHLGVDLFAAAGTGVMTPFDAEVLSVLDNDQPLDYGPTVILKHLAAGVPFWTLFGHLGREVVGRLMPGSRLAAGEQFAQLGTDDENGGWPPHLHFQVFADDLGNTGNLPGVAFPSQAEAWASICPDPDLILRTGKPLQYLGDETQGLRSRRAALFGTNLSLSYSDPLHIVRGIGAHLFDDKGRAYLDGVNNVCHLGHAHPAVVEAASRQLSVLNTNTRYLHPNILDLAETLGATLPEGLDVCFFVNSGSEANDLALRLARAFTGRTGTIVLEGGYHGNLTTLVEVSAYKFDGPGGAGSVAYVETARAPDPYRFPDIPADVVAADTRRASADLAASGYPPAAFMAESILSCGGQIVPPPGYLAAAYAHARSAGALCIADEIQTGFGRVGSHMWAFELHGVQPDIVTMGKPMGNGFPLGAVVTTRAIADAFANGMEYFNTYGGNPVSSAVGLAVLRTIREEGLQDHARSVGARLKAGLTELASRHKLIGDVRGEGLFLGMELVRDLETLEPADKEASYLVDRMKDLGVLLSRDGPLHNVIKMKPPLVFSMTDAEELLEKLDIVLRDTCLN